jgi:hypothetical protein
MRSYSSIALGAVFLLIATLTLGSFTQDKKKEAHQAPPTRALTPVTKAPLIPVQMTQTPAAAPAGKSGEPERQSDFPQYLGYPTMYLKNVVCPGASALLRSNLTCWVCLSSR